MTFELLEIRTMLSAVGLFERLDADVNAVSAVIISPAVDGYAFEHDDGEPNETLADISPSKFGGSSSADLDAIAINGDSGATPYAGTEVSFNADAISDGDLAHGGIDTDYGAQTYSYGKYFVEDAPEDGELTATWTLRSTGFEGGDGDYLTHRVTGHYVKIEEYAESSVIPEHTWYVSAVNEYIGTEWSNDVWHIEWLLPGDTEPQTDTQYGSLEFSETRTWGFDEMLPRLDLYSSTGTQAYARAYTSASQAEVVTVALSEVNVHLAASDVVPGGLPYLPSSAPKVKNVTLSHESSATTHAPYEFAGVVGDGDQIRTVPVGSVDTISVQFTKDVALTDSDLELIALNKVLTEPTPDLIQSPNLGNDYTAIWSLSSALQPAQYLMRLADTIEDLAGNVLDGEWTNPAAVTTTSSTTVFPSGDNVAGGDFEFVFTILPGDANRDNDVGSSDYAIYLANVNINDNARLWGHADFNGDGDVSSSDFAILLANYNSDFQDLNILADYDDNYAVNSIDYDDPFGTNDFYYYYYASNLQADLNGDASVTAADFAAFLSLSGFDIELAVVA